MTHGKIYLGDCLDILPRYADGFDHYAGVRRFDMVFADLPYGVTANKWDSRIDLVHLWRELLAVGKPNCAFIFTATQPFATALINSQPKLFRYDLVWDKLRGANFVNAKKAPLRQHESVLIFARRPTTYNPQKTLGHIPRSRIYAKQVVSSNYNIRPIGSKRHTDDSRYPASIFAAKRDDMRGKQGHPTQKPVALLEWLIKTYSNPGDTILDPTMGSGTTCVAAINTGRNYVGIEKEASYFITAAKRIGEARLVTT